MGSISSQAKRLKETVIATGVPKAYIRVRTETYRRNDQGHIFSEYGLAWGCLICPMVDMDKYASKMEAFPEDLVVKRHYIDTPEMPHKLIAVHVEEKING